MSRFEERICPACKERKNFRIDVKTCGCGGTNPFRTPISTVTPKDRVGLELEKLREKRVGRDAENAELRQRILDLEAENEVFQSLRQASPNVMDIAPTAPNDESESAMVLVWSDWHIEETVLPSQVSNKNAYNLAVADARFLKLLQGGLAWYRIQSRNTKIRNIVLALLGDFITGSIHEDLAEGNSLAPADAIHKVNGMLISGIKFMLENTPSDVKFIIPCHSGNHGRMTKEQRIATEAGNSLEYFMYLLLRDYFADEKRVDFIVQPGYHSHVRFFEGAYEIRFHHGHQTRYQGGVGGLTIPVNKKISQWNKAHAVNLDVFGHFHTRFDGGNFICNGSMMGYNSYAVSIGASYELPSQTCFLINREFGEKTAVMPIFVD